MKKMTNNNPISFRLELRTCDMCGHLKEKCAKYPAGDVGHNIVDLCESCAAEYLYDVNNKMLCREHEYVTKRIANLEYAMAYAQFMVDWRDIQSKPESSNRWYYIRNEILATLVEIRDVLRRNYLD